MIIERAITKKHIEDRFDKLQSMLRDIMIEKKENKELIKACQKISFLYPKSFIHDSIDCIT